MLQLKNGRLMQNVIVHLHLNHPQGRRHPRQCWVRNWILERPLFGQYEVLIDQLLNSDTFGYRNFVRLSPEHVTELVDRVGPVIQKEETRFYEPLPPGLKIAITLKYLATGDSYKTLIYVFRVALNTISLFVPEVCEAIYQIYKEEQLKCPSSPQKWCEKAQHFGQRWNFHHGVGAVDGKHVAIRCRRRSESRYYNYKGFYSVVQLALVDIDYRFVWADVETNECCSDAQIFNECQLRQSIMDGTMDIPDADLLPGDDKGMPYFIVPDDAFA